MRSLDVFLHEPRIAYFSMEMALLRSEIPTYAGGLGFWQAMPCDRPLTSGCRFVGVTLVSRAGYFRQEIDPQGRQIEHPANWDPAQWTRPLGAKVAMAMEERRVWIGAWIYVLEGLTGVRQPMVLLDLSITPYEKIPLLQILADIAPDEEMALSRSQLNLF